MEIVFLLAAVALASVVTVVLAINLRISSEIARLRRELGELDTARAQISGMLAEARETIGMADRDMKSLRTEFRSELDQKLKAAASST